VKRRLFTLAVDRRNPQVSILFLTKDIQKTVTRTDFLNELYLMIKKQIQIPSIDWILVSFES
jgi:hypothetical protein